MLKNCSLPTLVNGYRVAECISGVNLRPEVELMHLLRMHVQTLSSQVAENGIASRK